MENLEELLFQILLSFNNSPEVNLCIHQLPLCPSKCTFYYIKNFILEINQNYRIPIELLNIIKQQKIKKFTFSSILHYLLIQIHEHTTRHCKLEDRFCAYHQIFNLEYETQVTCKCINKCEITTQKSFDFIIEAQKFVKVRQDIKYTNASWKKYLKQSFEDNILSLIKNVINCKTRDCEFVPEINFLFKSISSNFLFSINYTEWPNFRETLRIFSMFPKNLMVSGDSKPFEIYSYLLLSRNSFGSLQYFRSQGSWVFIQNMQLIPGKYDELVEKIISNGFFPVHVLYSMTHMEVNDFRDNGFYSIQEIRNYGLPSKIIEFRLCVEDRQEEELLENYWVCECKIINYLETCTFCKKKMIKNNSWKCVCLKINKNPKCSCGRGMPSCSLCKELFSWKTVYCLRCNGGIRAENCKVCHFKQSKFMCPRCISEFWKCKVCLFPNKDSPICFRCNNPNEKQIHVQKDMPRFISLDFDD